MTLLLVSTVERLSFGTLMNPKSLSKRSKDRFFCFLLHRTSRNYFLDLTDSDFQLHKPSDHQRSKSE